MCEGGNKTLAVKETSEITPSELFEKVLDSACEAIAEAHPIGYGETKSELLARIVKVLVKTGKHKSAVRMAVEIPELGWRINALKEIAKDFAKAGNIKSARRIVDKIRNADPLSKAGDKAWEEIAKDLIKAGNIELTRRAIDEVKDINLQAELRIEIAKASHKPEDIALAKRTVNEINNAYRRAKLWLEIAKTTHENEDLISAVHAVAKIENPELRANALVEIAEILAAMMTKKEPR